MLASRALAVLALFPLVSASPAQQSCSAPITLVQGPGMATGSTYYSADEPPARFAKVPTGYVKVRFGQVAIDELCGKPPCGLMFLGCTKGDMIVLPDPFTSPNFAKITRHELGHFAGWPASHGA